MMPIRKGDGTGLSVPGFSEVRTGDGTVLWSAGPDIPDSGISRFEFEDDSQFSTLVDSWASNDGTLNNGTYVAGGVEFDGSSDNYGTVPNATVPFGSSSFSVAIRLTSTGTVARQSHWGVRDGSSGESISIEHRDGVLEVEYSDGTNFNTITTSQDYRDGNEHLFTVALGSGGIELFVDDATSIGTASYDGDFNISDNPDVARRGGTGGSDRVGPMTALDLRSYNERLSATQVSNLWNAGSING